MLSYAATNAVSSKQLKLTPPRHLCTTAKTASCLFLRWKSADNKRHGKTQSYEIQLTAKFECVWRSFKAKATGMTLTGLSPDTAYIIRIRATYERAATPFSPSVEVKTTKFGTFAFRKTPGIGPNVLVSCAQDLQRLPLDYQYLLIDKCLNNGISTEAMQKLVGVSDVIVRLLTTSHFSKSQASWITTKVLNEPQSGVVQRFLVIVEANRALLCKRSQLLKNSENSKIRQWARQEMREERFQKSLNETQQNNAGLAFPKKKWESLIHQVSASKDQQDYLKTMEDFKPLLKRLDLPCSEAPKLQDKKLDSVPVAANCSDGPIYSARPLLQQAEADLTREPGVLLNGSLYPLGCSYQFHQLRKAMSYELRFLWFNNKDYSNSNNNIKTNNAKNPSNNHLIAKTPLPPQKDAGNGIKASPMEFYKPHSNKMKAMLNNDLLWSDITGFVGVEDLKGLSSTSKFLYGCARRERTVRLLLICCCRTETGGDAHAMCQQLVAHDLVLLRHVQPNNWPERLLPRRLFGYTLEEGGEEDESVIGSNVNDDGDQSVISQQSSIKRHHSRAPTRDNEISETLHPKGNESIIDHSPRPIEDWFHSIMSNEYPELHNNTFVVEERSDQIEDIVDPIAVASLSPPVLESEDKESYTLTSNSNNSINEESKNISITNSSKNHATSPTISSITGTGNITKNTLNSTSHSNNNLEKKNVETPMKTPPPADLTTPIVKRLHHQRRHSMPELNKIRQKQFKNLHTPIISPFRRDVPHTPELQTLSPIKLPRVNNYQQQSQGSFFNNDDNDDDDDNIFDDENGDRSHVDIIFEEDEDTKKQLDMIIEESSDHDDSSVDESLDPSTLHLEPSLNFRRVTNIKHATHTPVAKDEEDIRHLNGDNDIQTDDLSIYPRGRSFTSPEILPMNSDTSLFPFGTSQMNGNGPITDNTITRRTRVSLPLSMNHRKSLNGPTTSVILTPPPPLTPKSSQITINMNNWNVTTTTATTTATTSSSMGPITMITVDNNNEIVNETAYSIQKPPLPPSLLSTINTNNNKSYSTVTTSSSTTTTEDSMTSSVVNSTKTTAKSIPYKNHDDVGINNNDDNSITNNNTFKGTTTTTTTTTTTALQPLPPSPTQFKPFSTKVKNGNHSSKSNDNNDDDVRAIELMFQKEAISAMPFPYPNSKSNSPALSTVKSEINNNNNTNNNNNNSVLVSQDYTKNNNNNNTSSNNNQTNIEMTDSDLEIEIDADDATNSSILINNDSKTDENPIDFMEITATIESSIKAASMPSFQRDNSCSTIVHQKEGSIDKEFSQNEQIQVQQPQPEESPPSTEPHTPDRNIPRKQIQEQVLKKDKENVKGNVLIVEKIVETENVNKENKDSSLDEKLAKSKMMIEIPTDTTIDFVDEETQTENDTTQGIGSVSKLNLPSPSGSTSTAPGSSSKSTRRQRSQRSSSGSKRQHNRLRYGSNTLSESLMNLRAAVPPTISITIRRADCTRLMLKDVTKDSNDSDRQYGARVTIRCLDLFEARPLDAFDRDMWAMLRTMVTAKYAVFPSGRGLGLPICRVPVRKYLTVDCIRRKACPITISGFSFNWHVDTEGIQTKQQRKLYSGILKHPPPSVEIVIKLGNKHYSGLLNYCPLFNMGVDESNTSTNTNKNKLSINTNLSPTDNESHLTPSLSTTTKRRPSSTRSLFRQLSNSFFSRSSRRSTRDSLDSEFSKDSAGDFDNFLDIDSNSVASENGHHSRERAKSDFPVQAFMDRRDSSQSSFFVKSEDNNTIHYSNMGEDIIIDWDGLSPLLLAVWMRTSAGDVCLGYGQSNLYQIKANCLNPINVGIRHVMKVFNPDDELSLDFEVVYNV